MRQLDVSSEAELEVFAAALRYERERSGLGFRFEADVNALFARLLENPFQFPDIEKGARRALVRHFPYGVFFTVIASPNTLGCSRHRFWEGCTTNIAWRVMRPDRPQMLSRMNLRITGGDTGVMPPRRRSWPVTVRRRRFWRDCTMKIGW